EHLTQPGKPLSNLGVAAYHRDAAGDRAGALKTYDRWAMSLRDRHAYGACVQVAEEGLGRFPTGEAEEERVAAADLWISVCDGLEPLGQKKQAAQALDRAQNLVAEGRGPESRFLRAGIAMKQGQAALEAGEISKGESLLEQAQRDFAEGGHDRER